MWTVLLLLPAVLARQEPTTITQGEGDQPRIGGQTLVFYDVRDLAAFLSHDFEAPQLGASTRPAREQRVEPARLLREEETVGLRGPANDDASAEEIERGGLAIAEVVRAFLDPPLAGPTEQIRATRGATLVVSARPVQQAWIEGFLNGLRRYEGLVELETTIYTAPRGVLREWGVAPSATLATPEELAAFRGRVDADERFEILNAPRLMQLPCQRANIAVVNQVAYVKGWEVLIVEPGGQEIADPEVAVIQEGLVVDARTSPLPGDRFGLQLELTSSEIQRPIPTRKVRISASTDEEVEIGEPEVKTARFAATVVLADGASAVLVTADTDPEKDLAVVVTVRKVEGPGQQEPK